MTTKHWAIVTPQKCKVCGKEATMYIRQTATNKVYVWGTSIPMCSKECEKIYQMTKGL